MKWMIVLALFAAAPASGQGTPSDALADTQLPDRARERDAKGLMETLRCVVCQGQSIADSDAPMAGYMRALVRRRIAAGETPEAVRAWLVARYGEYVTYDPPLTPATVPLWLAPVALLTIGVFVARASFRRRR